MSRLSLFVAMVFLFCTVHAGAADNASLNYQGRVLVQGFPYTGTGQMKAAILATTGTSTVVSLWSNDGSSVGGSEPASSFGVTVNGGVFDVMIGDQNLGAALPGILFNRNDELKVRVWFNDGTHGFQQLTPDRRITNPRRLGITEVNTSTTLYVNASTGNDLNSGLTPSSAKKTIQAAVNMVPSKISGNMTIRVAAGVYREEVTVYGVMAAAKDQFMILGDPTTVPSDTVTPNVRITGTDNDSTHLKVRENGINFYTCHNVAVSGILFDYCNSYGFHNNNSVVSAYRCKATNNFRGFEISGRADLQYCWASVNAWGIRFDSGESSMQNSGASDNTSIGVTLSTACATFSGGNNIKRNPTGIMVDLCGVLWLTASPTYVTNNTYGIKVIRNSAAANMSFLSYSGNTTNSVITDSYTD